MKNSYQQINTNEKSDYGTVVSEAEKPNEKLEYLKSCFESNIYTRIAGSMTTSSNKIFRCLLIAGLQIAVPLFIILDNLKNIEECRFFGDLMMTYDTIIVGTALIYLLWLTIVNEVMKSMRGFEFILGLTKVPRKWAAILGIFITPLSSCLTGIAGSVVLLSPEVKILDVAKDSMALFFVNRLDEDFGQLHDMIHVLKRKMGYIANTIDVEEDNDEIADQYLNEYGPFDEDYLKVDTAMEYIIFIMEYICYIAGFIIPFLYFLCAV